MPARGRSANDALPTPARRGPLPAWNSHSSFIDSKSKRRDPRSPVELDRVAVLVPVGQTAGLETGRGAALEGGQEEHRIVHVALARLGRARNLTLLDEGARDGAVHLEDLFADQKTCQVHDVRVQVAVRPRSGHLLLEAPQQGAPPPPPQLCR